MRSTRLFVSALALCAVLAAEAQKAVGPIPTQDQMRLQDMEMYAFLHYSLNTYTNQEWGFGNEDVSLFNPSRLDARQWAATCKAAGMKGIIFTAKHHSGFCMWPSEYTDYSVKSSPWRGGKGDVVRELADACKEYGLKFAFYLSPWDRHHPEYGMPAYVHYFRNQLRELLTHYGEVFEVWFDGANGGNGWYGGADETRKIDRLTYYGWAETYKMVRELQPHCVIWNDGAELRGDLRWVGTEAGYVGATNWSLISSHRSPERGDLHHGDENGDVWCPGEVDTSIRPGWFYHEAEDNRVKTPSQLMDIYYKSVGRNSTLLLNFPITPDGLIHPIDSARGVAFKRLVDAFYGSELKVKIKKEKPAKNPQVGKNSQVAKSQQAVKSVPSSAVPLQSYTLSFKQPTACNRFMACEDISKGQRVRKFTLEALVDGQWLPLRDKLVEAESTRGDDADGLTTIGRKRIVCFPTVVATKVRFTITDSKATPIIRKLSLFNTPEPSKQ